MIYALPLFLLTACGGDEAENDETVPTTEIDGESVVELESATMEVNEGMKTIEKELNQMDNEIDSLLNGI